MTHKNAIRIVNVATGASRLFAISLAHSKYQFDLIALASNELKDDEVVEVKDWGMPELSLSYWDFPTGDLF